MLTGNLRESCGKIYMKKLNKQKYRKLASLKFLYEISDSGELRNIKSKKILKSFDSDGYRRVDISIGGIHHKYFIHRLVAEAWLQPPLEDGMEIDHIDKNRSNNSYLNLH